MVKLLTDTKARSMRSGDNPIADGTITGLYLVPSNRLGHGKWLLRFTSPETKKRREMGFGTYPEVSIAQARRLGLEAREQIAIGTDPIAHRRQSVTAAKYAVEIPDFESAARTVHQDLALGFRNQKHAAQWISTLEAYVFPLLGHKRVDHLRAADFAAALRSIWLSKPETASRVRQRMNRVMNWCVANDYATASPLPAVDNLLPKQPAKKQRVVHHPAVPWLNCPNVISELFTKQPLSVGKQALFFTILTAARSGEVRGLSWTEIDWQEKVWTVPSERMKARRAHRVPLSAAALKLLEERAAFSDGVGLVFTLRNNQQLSDMTLTKILRYHSINSDTPERLATVHGFRSTFRDWASEKGYPRDVAERALAHTITNQSEAAYHRTDLLEKRRSMMNDWAEYIASGVGLDSRKNS